MISAFFTALVATSTLATTVNAFAATAKTNVAIYWGQGPNQERLVEVCKSPNVDIINIAFVNVFPDQGPGGYPGTNFGDACSAATYKHNGVSTDLLSGCTYIGEDIKTCQESYGKKILLSLGGGSPTNQWLHSNDTAVAFAEFLWGAFGPVTTAWTKAGKPRPFGTAVVDGFDFDIESSISPAPTLNGKTVTDYKTRGYAKMIQTFKRDLFPESKKNYFLSAAPQCVIPDAHFASLAKNVWFDFMFVQFYNTPTCSARAGVNYINGASSVDISYSGWAAIKFHNPNTRVYIGLPAATGASNSPDYYISPAEAYKLTKKYFSNAKFGGVALWEATYGMENVVCGKNYPTWIKHILTALKSNTAIDTTTDDCPDGQTGCTSCPAIAVSTNGRCGTNFGTTCSGSKYGSCCSDEGYCGSTEATCSGTCDSTYSNCTAAASITHKTTTSTKTTTSSKAATTTSSAKTTTTTSKKITTTTTSKKTTTTTKSTTTSKKTTTTSHKSTTTTTRAKMARMARRDLSSTGAPYPTATGANSTSTTSNVISPLGLTPSSSVPLSTGASSSPVPTSASVVSPQYSNSTGSTVIIYDTVTLTITELYTTMTVTSTIPISTSTVGAVAQGPVGASGTVKTITDVITETITTCFPAATDCSANPAAQTVVTITKTIEVYETVYPTADSTSTKTVQSTETLYSTGYITLTSCAASISDCAGNPASQTTSTYAVFTTTIAVLAASVSSAHPTPAAITNTGANGRVVVTRTSFITDFVTETANAVGAHANANQHSPTATTVIVSTSTVYPWLTPLWHPSTGVATGLASVTANGTAYHTAAIVAAPAQSQVGDNEKFGLQRSSYSNAAGRAESPMLAVVAAIGVLAGTFLVL